jgi:hypothetical protein
MSVYSLGLFLKSKTITASVPSLCHETPEKSPEINPHSMREVGPFA